MGMPQGGQRYFQHPLALGASCICSLVQHLVATLPACDLRMLPWQAVGCSFPISTVQAGLQGLVEFCAAHLGYRSTRLGSWKG